MANSVNETNFSQEVLQSSSPVLVHFWAPWCGLCRAISPVLLQFKSEWKEQVNFVDVNADQNLRLANTYRLRSLPTLIFFKKGSIIHRIDYFQGREDLQRSLNQVMLNILARSA